MVEWFDWIKWLEEVVGEDVKRKNVINNID